MDLGALQLCVYVCACLLRFGCLCWCVIILDGCLVVSVAFLLGLAVIRCCCLTSRLCSVSLLSIWLLFEDVMLFSAFCLLSSCFQPVAYFSVFLQHLFIVLFSPTLASILLECSCGWTGWACGWYRYLSCCCLSWAIEIIEMKRKRNEIAKLWGEQLS